MHVMGLWRWGGRGHLRRGCNGPSAQQPILAFAFVSSRSASISRLPSARRETKLRVIGVWTPSIASYNWIYHYAMGEANNSSTTILERAITNCRSRARPDPRPGRNSRVVDYRALAAGRAGVTASSATVQAVDSHDERVSFLGEAIWH